MVKIDREFKLPKPKATSDGFTFLPVVRLGRVVPFGYEQDPDDKDILLPIILELELMEKAKSFLKQYSYRDVANWLTKQSGRSISHVGLRTRVKSEQQRTQESSNYRYLARCYKEASEKAKHIEERSLGRRESNSSGAGEGSSEG
jgi:hypothetical protein